VKVQNHILNDEFKQQEAS